ncbi:MAG: preprotein translocase subunit SecG [Actinobacteria bacterium]|nr:preprotein translocase subunit SecG [Actinomycetota bacterium]
MNGLVVILLVLHVVVSFALIVFVLLHSGKGTGMSSMFSGALPTTSVGTSIIEKNLNKITVVLAVTFVVNLLLLMVLYTPGG